MNKVELQNLVGGQLQEKFEHARQSKNIYSVSLMECRSLPSFHNRR